MKYDDEYIIEYLRFRDESEGTGLVKRPEGSDDGCVILGVG